MNQAEYFEKLDEYMNRYKFDHPEAIDSDLMLAREQFPKTKLVLAERKVKEVIPDTTAQIFWLKNRRPEKWREQQKVELSGNLETNNPYEGLTTEELKKVSRNDAYRLIYTEGTYVMAESTMQPFTEDFEEYGISTVGDGKVCSICRDIAEKTFNIKDRQPGVNFPPFHSYCRCTFLIRVSDWNQWMAQYEKKHPNGQAEKVMERLSGITGSDMIKSSGVKEDKIMSEIKMLGKINLTFLEKEFGKIQTDGIIVTNERLSHIQERHPQDYKLFEKYGRDSVQDPDYIVKDEKNAGTVFMIKRLPDTNLNVVVRVALNTDKEGLKNSVMTFYRIRERNLSKIIKKNKLLYKKE